MEQDSLTQDDNPEKPKIKKIQYNNPELENSFDQEQEYSAFEVTRQVGEDLKSLDSIRIIFENGAKYRLDKIDQDEIREQAFQKNDPNSAWETNKFDAEDLVQATQVVIDEYTQESRQRYEDFSDWHLIQEVIF